MKRLLFLGLSAVLSAAHWPELYDDAYLRTWQGKFEAGLKDNWYNVILPRLTESEYAHLHDARLLVPLWGAKREPLEFYSEPRSNPPAIVMPAASLRFVGDLCLAGQWLWAHDYDLRPVLNYINVLKYRDLRKAEEREIPAPLEAIGVPDNARSEARTLKGFQNCLNTAFIFILLHEAGHVLYRHSNAGQQGEIEADRFAIVLWNRLGEIPPLGMTNFFSAAALLGLHRCDFETESAYRKWISQSSHPLTAERMEALAAGIREGRSDAGAREIEGVAGQLRDLRFLCSSRALGTDLPLEYLRKR